MGLAMTGFWITSLLTNQLLLSLIDAVGPAWAFCLLCMTTLCALAFVSRCVPETKDKTLDEIQDMFKQAETLERGVCVCVCVCVCEARGEKERVQRLDTHECNVLCSSRHQC